MTDQPAAGIRGVIEARDINEVLHFTTNKGLTGILATRTVKSRSLLKEDQYLEKLFTPNAHIRRDKSWTNYVNLSIGRVNGQFFSRSRDWHALEDLWWAVLSFDPAILEHDGVVFTTTNNIYSGVNRAKGVEGLESMFADEVHQYLDNYSRRYPGMPTNTPTCEQAEVLYPDALSTDFLRTIYVAQSMHAAAVEAQFAGLDHPLVDVIVTPTVFS